MISQMKGYTTKEFVSLNVGEQKLLRQRHHYNINNRKVTSRKNKEFETILPVHIFTNSWEMSCEWKAVKQ